MSSESHGPPDRRKRQVPPKPTPPSGVAPGPGTDPATLLRDSQPSPRGGPSSAPDGAGSTAGFSAIHGVLRPTDGRTVSMSHPIAGHPPGSRGSSTHRSQHLESTLRRFEVEWRKGHEPRIDDYLTESGPDRGDFLFQLISKDMECRLKEGRALLIENYLTRYPELGEDDAVNLIVRDYSLRRRRGMMTTVDDYLTRFPRLKGRLLEHFPPVGPTPHPDSGGSDGGETDPATTARRSGPVFGAGLALPKKFEVIERIGAGGMGEV